MRYPSGHDSPSPLIGLVPIVTFGGGLALGGGAGYVLGQLGVFPWGALLPYLGGLAGGLLSRRVLRAAYTRKDVAPVAES